MAVSFAPVFSTAPGRVDPVVAALSQVGLPSSVHAQTTIVRLVNPAVPPVADLLGGTVAIPRLWVCATLVDEEYTGTGVCRHVGAATRVMAIGTSGGWLLPFPSSAVWAGYELPVMG